MTTIHQEFGVRVARGAGPASGVDQTGSFGAPDLDRRPAEPARSSLFAWVRRFGSCRYGAPRISEAAPGPGTEEPEELLGFVTGNWHRLDRD